MKHVETAKIEHNHWEFCNGHMIWLESKKGARVETSENEAKMSVWESIEFVAEQAYDARDLGGLAFDGAVLVVLHHAVSVPILFLIGGVLFGVWILRIKRRK